MDSYSPISCYYEHTEPYEAQTPTNVYATAPLEQKPGQQTFAQYSFLVSLQNTSEKLMLTLHDSKYQNHYYCISTPDLLYLGNSSLLWLLWHN